jgi:hypothetical protein
VISFTRESNVLEDLASEPCPAADALQKLRIVQDGFKSAAEAENSLRIFIWRVASSGRASRKDDRQSPIGEAG